MSGPFPSHPEDSTRRVLGEWNLGGEPSPDDGLDDSLLAPAAAPGLARRESVRRFGPGREAAPSGLAGERRPVPYQDFALDPGGGPADDSLLAADSSHTRERGLPGRGARPPGGAAAPSSPRPGEVVGGFRIVAELGRGAFARVYLAEQTELGNRLVALKVSRAEGDEPQMLARLQHTHIVPIHSVYDDPESGLRLMCMPYLGGANLAQVLEAAGTRPAEGVVGRSLVEALDEADQRLQSGPGVGPYPAGRRLDSGVRPAGPGASPVGPPEPEARASALPPSFGRGSLFRLQGLWDRLTYHRGGAGEPADHRAEARDFDQPARQFLRGADTIQAGVWIVARLAEGLEHAHSRGLLHRDLKPSNILIAGDGTPMLLDFNLSSSVDPADAAGGEKAMLGGTLPYMSPEHLDAFNPNGTTTPDAVDERSDLYALGLILFEMVAGEHPFPEPPPRLPLLEMIQFLADQRTRPPSLRGGHRGVPWGLDAIVSKCLDPNPASRYQRARDLAEDLNRFLDDRPLRFAPERSPRERLAKWARRNPRLCGNTSIASFAALLIVSLGGLIGTIHGNMQSLNTRLKLQVFRDDFTECQFLLNLSSGPAEHFGRGIELARRTLDRQRIDRRGVWRADSWPRRLTPAEQSVLRGQTSELILLMARAQVYLSSRVGVEGDQRKTLEWAIPWLDRAERLDPSPPAALYDDRARYLSALGRADLAAADRRRAAGKSPASSRDYALLGTAHLARGDLGRAEPALLKAVDLDHRAFWAWFALGHCRFEQGRFLEAAGDFSACAGLEPKFAWPHMNRGVALARAGRLIEARAAYDHALEANPRFAEAWLNHALTDLELDDLAAAERSVGRALALGRRGPGVYAVRAEVQARKGDRAGAEKSLAKLLADRPDDPLLLTARGVFRIGSDPAGSRTDLRRALELEPGNARAHSGLALLLRHDDPRAALAEADAALRTDPFMLDALQLRAVLRARLGDLAAVDDAERVSLVQTPNRLYNASCALALLVKTAGQERLAPRALGLLDRALDAGFPAERAASDPDLAAIRDRPGFRESLEKRRRLAP